VIRWAAFRCATDESPPNFVTPAVTTTVTPAVTTTVTPAVTSTVTPAFC